MSMLWQLRPSLAVVMIVMIMFPGVTFAYPQEQEEASAASISQQQEPPPVVTDFLLVPGMPQAPSVRAWGLAGQSRLTRQQLDLLPGINRNLTDALARLPGVTVSGRSRSSMGNGEITPDDISIHGARFYDHLFLLDGASTNNDLDPAYDNPGDLSRLPSHGQGYFVDLDAIESVTVHDHNISARYGGFTGGVVDARTRRYQEDQQVRFSWRHTSDVLSHFHVDPALEDAFKRAQIPTSSSYTPNQPHFRKHFLTLGADIGHRADWGSTFTASYREADIPLFDAQPAIYEVMDDGRLRMRPNDGDHVHQYRESRGFNSKTSWQPGSGQWLDINLRYSGHQSRLSLGGSSNSAYDHHHQGIGSGLEYGRNTTWGGWTLEVSVDGLSDERKIAVERPEILVIGTNARNVNSGVPGPMQRRQRNVWLKPALQLHRFRAIGAEHHMAAGLELGRIALQEQRRVRARDYTWFCRLSWPSVCTEADEFYLWARYSRIPYTLDITQKQAAVWMEDHVHWDRLDLRLGFRVDHNSFLGNTEWAPRLAIGYALSGDGRTRLKAGLNRYYGRSFMELEANRIRDLSTFQELFLSPANSEPVIARWGTTNWEALDHAKTPYDDEATFGISQEVARWKGGLDWVHRRGRDQFSHVQSVNPNIRRFGNLGRSNTDTVNLNLQSPPLHWLAANWHMALRSQWQKTRSNAMRLTSGLGAGYHETIPGNFFGVTDPSRVIVDGKVIALEDLPTTAFNARWRADLEFGAHWPRAGLHWSHFIDLRAPYRGLNALGRQAVAGTSDVLQAYEMVKYGTRVNWDMQLRWELGHRTGAYLQLDILNVTDKANLARSDGNTRYYDIGRQFWVEVGVRL